MFSWMQAHSIMTPHNTRSLHGYYRAHVSNKDAIAMLDLNQTFYMWKGTISVSTTNTTWW